LEPTAKITPLLLSGAQTIVSGDERSEITLDESIVILLLLCVGYLRPGSRTNNDYELMHLLSIAAYA
jgi:hypothetical protein